MILNDIKNISVLGAGTMGPGLAQSYAACGFEVKLYSRRQATLQKALKVLNANLDIAIESGIIKAEEKKDILSQIATTDSLSEALHNTHYIVETVVENRDVKKELYKEIDKNCSENITIASNTSTLDIFKIMVPRRLKTSIIAHWFAPPHIVPLVEVVKGPDTTESTVTLTLELLNKIGKKAVLLNKFVPGFVINRLQLILGQEIFHLLDSGVITTEQLDLAVKTSLAPRMMVLGVVQRYDFTGLDLSARNLQDEAIIAPPLNKRPKSLFNLAEKGHLGVKTGRGFFDYSKKPLEEILKERDRKLWKAFSSIDDYLKPIGGNGKND